MAFENLDLDDMDTGGEDGPPPEEASNRAFLIAAGVLGAVAVLALLCIAAYALILRPQQIRAREEQAAMVNAQNTQVALAITQTSAAIAAVTFTPTVTPIPNTPTPSPTAVIAVPTNTLVPTQDPRTATVAALLTQAAMPTNTPDPSTSELPTTGFADEVGLPALLGLSLLLVVVIFLARRLRSV
jgi:LPXTG-motif cell wall-anchored protein